jgi:hypothetical protein
MRSAGYSGTPLIKKLGLKPGQRACFLNAPEDLPKTLGALPMGIQLIQRLPKTRSLDFIHFFTKERNKLEKSFPQLKAALNWDGILWISWPKGSSKVATDINENIVREIGLDVGLVDVKVAAVDEVWSGLKFVHRVKNRPR